MSGRNNSSRSETSKYEGGKWVPQLEGLEINAKPNFTVTGLKQESLGGGAACPGSKQGAPSMTPPKKDAASLEVEVSRSSKRQHP